jgi:CheY-like chemotaxis protein
MLKKSSQVMLSPAPLPLIRGYSGARRRVLLADDDAVGRGLVSSLLHDLGFVVSVAEDGAEALRAVRVQPPDLLITDLIMPRVDGIELAQTLRRSAATKAMKMLALSASTALLNERSIQLDIFDAVLKKPVRFESLLDTIETLLGLIWEREGVEAPAAASQMMTAESETAIRAQLMDLAQQGDVTAMAELLSQYAPRSFGLAALRRDLNPYIECFDTASIRRTLGLA